MSPCSGAFSIQTALKYLVPEKRDQVQAALNRIRVALDQSSTQLRDDSLLAWRYAVGDLGPNFPFADVIFELLLTRYLYNYTPYPILAAALVQTYAQPQPCSSEMLRTWLLPVAKIKALKVTGLPEVWPWLEDQDREDPKTEE